MSRESEDLQLWRALGNSPTGGESVAEVWIRLLQAKRVHVGLTARGERELSALMAHRSIANRAQR